MAGRVDCGDKESGSMTKQVHYGAIARAFHWVIVALLAAQYLVGWLMPDVHGGPPGNPMIWHISTGSLILMLIIARLIWRLTHPVAPDSSLAPWQRLASGTVHWMLYVLVLLATLSGWLFASARGWAISWFFVLPMPMLTGGDRALVRAIDGWHQIFEWALLIAIGVHVAAAFVHLLYYRDGVMQRMLPGKPMIGAAQK
jgi:cytochrome b561